MEHINKEKLNEHNEQTNTLLHYLVCQSVYMGKKEKYVQ